MHTNVTEIYCQLLVHIPNVVATLQFQPLMNVHAKSLKKKLNFREISKKNPNTSSMPNSSLHIFGVNKGNIKPFIADD